MTEVVKEIMKRVDKADIPLEDGEFTIDGTVYKTVEIEGEWKCCYFGSSFDKLERNVVCEIFVGHEPKNIFIVQHQEKTKYRANISSEYRYSECINVKRQTEESVIKGWVRA